MIGYNVIDISVTDNGRDQINEIDSCVVDSGMIDNSVMRQIVIYSSMTDISANQISVIDVIRIQCVRLLFIVESV